MLRVWLLGTLPQRCITRPHTTAFLHCCECALHGNSTSYLRCFAALHAFNTANLCLQFCDQLKQPLCLALLRNCMSPYDEAFAAATKLFTALLLQPKLRGGLKAELGAFFPLLLLRPLEADK